MKLIKRYALDESGSGAVEYGLLAAMVACFVLSAVQKMGFSLNGKFKILYNALS